MTKEIFRKVRVGEFKVCYIDESGLWYKQPMNGKMLKSKPMTIEKDYGTVELDIEIDEIYGYKRAI